MDHQSPGSAWCSGDTLADGEGLGRGSGDDREVDESLFFIAVGPHDRRVRQVADRFRGWEAAPGDGAGVPVDVLSPLRRSRADKRARTQRPA